MASLSYLSCMVLILTCGMTLKSTTDANEIWSFVGHFEDMMYDCLLFDGGNVLVSPFSIRALLSLLYYGSNGTTANVLKNNLKLPQQNQTAIEYKALIEHLTMGKFTHLLLANKIYVADSLKLVSKFQTDSEYFFNSDIEIINFGDGATAAAKINEWVGQKTHNKINKIVSPDLLKPSTRIVLLNALYFCGLWLSPFSLISEKQKFYASKTEQIEVTMLKAVDYFEYKIDSGRGYQFIRLPYKGGIFSLAIVLPTSKTGLSNLEYILNHDPSYFYLRGKSQYVQVTIPRFSIEKELSLNKILMKFGFRDLFSELDIPDIVSSEENLVINEVMQKVYIDVHENGTGRGRSNFIEESSTFKSNGKRPSVYFTADHPFLFVLEAFDGTKRHVLLEGRVSNPEYS